MPPLYLGHVKSRPGSHALSLVEVLTALAIFAVAFSGLFLANQNLMRNVRQTMERNILASFLQLKIAEIDPFSPTIETTYDVTTKTAMTLPNGREGYFTRLIESDATAADVKQVNVYLYHRSTDTTPYRRLRKEMSPKALYYDLGATSYWRDSLGNVWIPWSSPMSVFSTTAGSYRSGATTANMTNTTFTLSSTGSNDTPFTTGHSAASATLGYTLLASAGAQYKVTLGFVDETGTSQPVTISINGSSVETFDLMTESGGVSGRSLTKSYVTTPTTSSGVSVIQVTVSYGGGASASKLATLVLERMEE